MVVSLNSQIRLLSVARIVTVIVAAITAMVCAATALLPVRAALAQGAGAPVSQYQSDPSQETAGQEMISQEMMSGPDEFNPDITNEFYFTRAIYGESNQADWGPRWAVDYPKADLQFLTALKRLTIVDGFETDHTLMVGSEELNNFPFVYILEVGALELTEDQVIGLRRYLNNGGFMVVDDFWGSWAWDTFEYQMQRVFPDHDIVDIPLDHPVFHAFYDIDNIIQVPNVHQGSIGGPTHEYDGRVPRVRGIFDDKGRLMVLVNWNTDLGDAWEWADRPSYPLRFSTYAYEIGINFVVYAMSY